MTFYEFNVLHLEEKQANKLLGHSSMKVTQDSYGKIVEKKVSLEMNRLKGR